MKSMPLLPSHRFSLSWFIGTSIGALLLLGISCCPSALASDRAEGRYSFSLTTFDPRGKLGQVERALEAAAQGTPVVCLVRSTGMFLAAPQVLPSPLLQDDGTSRFAAVTSEILVAHTGLSADGRVVVAEAQRLAIEHEYTFDEEIPIEIFLEELSLLFQEYTMKAGARPFGTSIIIAHEPRSLQQHRSPCFYLLDPSGTVKSLGKCAVVNGNLQRTNIHSKLASLVVDDADDNSNESSKPSSPGEAAAAGATTDSDREAVADCLREALVETVMQQKGKGDDDSMSSLVDGLTILTACLPRRASDGQVSIRRHIAASSEQTHTTNS